MAVDLGTYGPGPAGTGGAGRSGGDPGGRGGPSGRAGGRRARERRPRLGRRCGLALTATAVLAADLAVLGLRAGATDRGPAAAVHALLAALAAGNGPAAAALVVPPAGPALLTAAAGHADPARITVVRQVGDTAVVDLHVTGPDDLLTLRRTAPTGLFTAPRWRVVAGLPVLHVLAPPYEPVVLVDGHPFAAPLAAGGVTVFPGRHQAGLPARSPAGALSVPVDVAGGRPTAVLQPVVDDATVAALSQAISYQVIPGGQAVEGPNSVHPSHVDIDTVTLAPDGRTLRFVAVLDMLIRAQVAYDAPTLMLTGTATATGPVVAVTSLSRAPIGP